MSPVNWKVPVKPAPDSVAAKDSRGQRLDGWKEIAGHLGRSTRCAQRWEKNLGLPVHRIRHVDGYTVYADAGELDAWRRSRDDAPAPPQPMAERERLIPPRPARWGASILALRRLFLKAVPARVLRT